MEIDVALIFVASDEYIWSISLGVNNDALRRAESVFFFFVAKIFSLIIADERRDGWLFVLLWADFLEDVEDDDRVDTEFDWDMAAEGGGGAGGVICVSNACVCSVRGLVDTRLLGCFIS